MGAKGILREQSVLSFSDLTGIVCVGKAVFGLHCIVREFRPSPNCCMNSVEILCLLLLCVDCTSAFCYVNSVAFGVLLCLRNAPSANCCINCVEFHSLLLLCANLVESILLY